MKLSLRPFSATIDELRYLDSKASVNYLMGVTVKLSYSSGCVRLNELDITFRLRYHHVCPHFLSYQFAFRSRYRQFKMVLHACNYIFTFRSWWHQISYVYPRIRKDETYIKSRVKSEQLLHDKLVKRLSTQVNRLDPQAVLDLMKLHTSPYNFCDLTMVCM